jgi:hypothetical protein
VNACIDYVKENRNEKIMMIISNNFVEIIVENLKSFQNLVGIYIQCKNEQDEVQLKQWASNHVKVILLN